MIEQSQQLLLEAIKASLFMKAFTYTDDTDWDAVLKEAKSQTVMGLISPVIPVYDESIVQGKAYYMRILHEQDKLLKLFEENDIPCVILKGCAVAVYYPKPHLRTMGDVDFLVQRDQFDKALKLMESNGYVYSHGKDENVKHPRHLAYVKNGIEFELHHHFSSIGFNMDDILEKAIDCREYRELNGYSFPVLPEIENGLVLLAHINQHLIKDYLGLRQIIDWEMYYDSVMSNDNWKSEFKPLAKRIGLWNLAVNVTRMCEKHLGLPKSIEPLKRNNHVEEDSADELLENILNYGNFGRKQSITVEKSGKTFREVISIIKNKGFFSYFQDIGLGTWKLCKQYPVLKPFAFIYGMFRFFVKGTAGIMKKRRYKNK